jgi:hypothetical protein
MPLSNASSAALRPPSHGSGPGWIATPSLYDSFIRYSMPVYPGACVAVGTPITERPPHRPVLALLTHTVPTLDDDVANPTRSARSVGSVVHRGALALHPDPAPAVGSPWPAAFPPCPPPPGCLVLFGHFAGTMQPLDSRPSFIKGLPFGVPLPAHYPDRALGQWLGLPVLAHGVSLHAWGLGLRRAVPHSRYRVTRRGLPDNLTPSAP